MTGPQIIVLATPVFFALIGLEYWIARRRGRHAHRLNDAMNSIGLGVLSQIAGVFTAAVTLGIYSLAYAQLAPWHLAANTAWVWIAGLLLYDFCYYWNHRLGHTVGLLWAAHAVHHQSEDYNLSTALRQTSSGWLVGWLFYLPMAVLGFPPPVFGVVALIDLLYQFWVHTEQIGKLGWFDRWFCAPSNHRVHHAVNQKYLDKNYGGILIVWDRLFGSHAEEDDAEPCLYGTRGPLRSWNPVWANLHLYAEMARDTWHATTWRDRLRIWLAPPGWRPADVAARWPQPAFDIARIERYDPPMDRGRQLGALTVFMLALAITTGFLWNAHRLAPFERWAAAVGVVALLCLVGRLSDSGKASLRASVFSR